LFSFSDSQVARWTKRNSVAFRTNIRSEQNTRTKAFPIDSKELSMPLLLYGSCHSLHSRKDLLRKAILALLVSLPIVLSGTSAASSDVTAPIHQFIDGFNNGDTKSAFAAYSTGDITIVDEFAPHRWLGPHAPQDWAADYEKHAQATGVSDGVV
jgi:hypothetical protein